MPWTRRRIRPSRLSGFVAAGAQMLLFSTGVGNSYVSLLAPTIKLSANPVATQTLREQLDFDASAVFRGTQTLDARGRAICWTCWSTSPAAP